MSIGENIKNLRLLNDMTQEQLGTKVGVTISMISQIERGTKVVTLPLGKQIAEVFGCKVDDLFNEVGSVLNGK